MTDMGALPKGYSLDDLLTYREASRWLGVSEDWLKRHEDLVPGVIAESQRIKHLHPRTYLEARLNLSVALRIGAMRSRAPRSGAKSTKEHFPVAARQSKAMCGKACPSGAEHGKAKLDFQAKRKPSGARRSAAQHRAVNRSVPQPTEVSISSHRKAPQSATPRSEACLSPANHSIAERSYAQ